MFLTRVSFPSHADSHSQEGRSLLVRVRYFTVAACVVHTAQATKYILLHQHPMHQIKSWACRDHHCTASETCV